MANVKSLILLATIIVIHYSDICNSSYCTSCSDYCSGEKHRRTLCKCDRDCQIYNDCCSNSSSPQANSSCPPSRLLPSLPDTRLHCQSAYINSNITVTGDNEAYFMIASCPDNWTAPDANKTRNHCTSTQPMFLAPVTDTRTGLAYRNKYCAHCNEATQVVAWQTSLACNFSLYELIRTSNLTTILQHDPYILQRECKECSYIPPSTLSARSCIPAVKTCPPYSSRMQLSVEEYEPIVQHCQSGALDPVRGIASGEVYRNSACATCNMEKSECLYALNEVSNKIEQNCLAGNNFESILGPDVDVQFAFTITLRSLGKDQVLVSTGLGGTVTLPVTCPEGQVAVSLQCRPTTCPKGYISNGDTCVPVGTVPLNCSNTTIILGNTSFIDLGNDSILLESDHSIVEVLDYDELGRPIICTEQTPTHNQAINCTSALVALNDSEYTVLDNDSILFLNTTLQVLYYDKFNRPLVCPDLLPSENSSTSVGLLSNLAGIIELTYVGCSLSVIGTLGLLVTYILFKELRTYPGLVLMNLCAAILATSLTFPIGSFILQTYPLVEVCSTLAIVLHYSYLAQFAWMSVFSYEVMRTFYQARKLVQKSKEAKCKLLAIYLATAWFLPLVVVVIATILNYNVVGLIRYGENSDEKLVCWLNNNGTVIFLFILPLVLSLAFNLVTFTITSILLYKAYREQSKMTNSKSLAIVRVWLASFIITGLTWIFGFLAIPAATSWMWYPFVIFNSSQGFALSATFLSTKKVLGLYKQFFKGVKSRDTILHSKKTSTITLHLFESSVKQASEK